MPFFRKKRKAFSLVELIAVIGTIALLLSLLLPAVQAARSSARRMTCSSNLRQVALAVELHKNAIGRMPSGTLSSRAKFPFTGLLLPLLPYLEQESIMSQSSAEFRRTRNPFEHRSISNVIKTFLCPEDGRIHSTVFAVRHNMTVGVTSFLGVSGVSATRPEGVFFIDSETRDRDILDGLSNTLLLGERPPSRFLDYGWWYAGTGSNGEGTLDHTLGTEETTPTQYQTCRPTSELVKPLLDDECSARVFWSLHGSNMHFSFCDTSIHWISQTTDRTVLSRLATKAAGDIAPIE